MSNADTTRRPQLNNWPKFVLMLTAEVGMIIAWLIGVATWDQIETPLVGVVLYAAGNGVAAVKGQPQQPVFSSRSIGE